MKINKVHCFFEQSGTFKKEFKKLGYNAIDYDIENSFEQTDFVIDLFKEIENAYDGIPNLLDLISSDDLIIAFFPCIRFEWQIQLWFSGNNYAQQKWSDLQKLEYDLKLHKELNHFYSIITKLAIVCIKRNLKLIIENPYKDSNYLNRYWCLKPTIIDKDRTDSGDYYTKPTQYWFINCVPSYNYVLFEPLYLIKKKIIEKEQGINRSLISTEYANRFIREYILDRRKENEKESNEKEEK